MEDFCGLFADESADDDGLDFRRFIVDEIAHLPRGHLLKEAEEVGGRLFRSNQFAGEQEHRDVLECRVCFCRGNLCITGELFEFQKRVLRHHPTKQTPGGFRANDRE